MAHELLHRADVVAALKQVSREAVTQRVRPNRFVDACAACSLTNGALHRRFMYVVATDGTGARVPAWTRRGEHVLPAEIGMGVRILPLERVG